MRRIILPLLFCLACTPIADFGQVKNVNNVVYDTNFKWTITIPENFEKVSPEEWANLQRKGQAAVEETYEKKIANYSKNIFVFKKDKAHYIEANWQPYDTKVDGNYKESLKAIVSILYETFSTQVPGIKIDTTFNTENIDGMQFEVAHIRIPIPETYTLSLDMFSRLFDNRDFTVNIMYIDKTKGMQMLDALRNSKFSK
ncbi:MAG: hypothetical protein KF744_16620 [Taibaiella sp.]|nr:hypothetical protein [Taibaiella sp.]